MDTTGYVALTRQSGLLQELQVLANNIANASTTGFRGEMIHFSEFVSAKGGGDSSVSMATARARNMTDKQGGLIQTNGTFDLAIEGDGFFQVETANGPRLTRAGAFTPDANGMLVTHDGLPVLDSGGAPVLVPNQLGPIGISADGTVTAGDNLVGQIGLFRPLDPQNMRRVGATMFDPGGAVEPVDNPRMQQGYLEGANVDAISQISRMIEVQRAYELGQSFMDKEDERIRSVLQATR